MMRAFVICAAVLALSLVLWPVASAWAWTDPITPGITISLRQFNAPGSINVSADGTPQDFVSAGDGSGQIYVPLRDGKIDVFSSSGQLLSTYLDMTSPSVGLNIYTGGEGGLLGMAFSPNFTAPASTSGSGKFYTFDTEPFTTSRTADFSSPEIAPTTSVAPSNQIVIREWSVSGGVVNPTSRILVTINHPQSNHQGGALRFGSDGDLYIGLGDGGGGDDNFGGINSTTDGHNNAIGNGQDTTVPFGKVLRIDPKGSNSANGQYGIPATNPFASGAGGNMKEIYAYGFRNPYRFNFDSVTGDLWIGDVGQSAREEADKIAVNTPGGNYGWPFKEGTANGQSGRTVPNGFTSIAPIGEYFHDATGGEAIIGGFIYHGSEIPVLDGMYVFGDLGGTSNTIGKLYYMNPSTGLINSFQLDTRGPTPSTTLISFGQDTSGEIYALSANGNMMQLVPQPDSVWSGGATSNNWSVAANWTVAPTNGTSLVFAGVQRLSNVNDNLSSVRSIDFDSTAGAFTLSGNPLAISKGITNSSSNTQTVNLNLSLSASQQFTAASGNLVIGGAIATGGNTLTVAGAANTTLAGPISAAGALAKSGSGKLTVSGNNSYGGGTTVDGGTLVVGHIHALGTGALTINSTGETQLQAGLSGPVELASLTIAGGSSIAGTLDVTDTDVANLDDVGGSSLAAAATVQSVPEPSGVLLAVLGLLLAMSPLLRSPVELLRTLLADPA